MKQWRPEGWETQHPNPCINCEDKARPGLGDLTSAKFCLESCTEDNEYETFEAGADAMLEALIAKLERMNVSLDINDHLAIENDTWLVIKGLILDEETDE